MNVPDHHVLRERLLKHLKGKDLFLSPAPAKTFILKLLKFFEKIYFNVLLMGSRDVTSQRHSKEFSKCGRNGLVNN